jgi:hypothetical protein
MFQIIWFQAGWWCLVLGASNDWQTLSLIVTAILLSVHFLMFSQRKKADLLTMLSIAALGVLGDFTLLQLGVLILPGTSTAIFPPWLVGIWLMFALTLPYSFFPLLKRKWTFPLLGLGAVASYYAGKHFEILYLAEPLAQTALIMTLWWIAYLLIFEKVITKIRG